MAKELFFLSCINSSVLINYVFIKLIAEWNWLTQVLLENAVKTRVLVGF